MPDAHQPDSNEPQVHPSVANCVLLVSLGRNYLVGSQLHPSPNTLRSTQRTASVSIATAAEPSASRSRAPKLETTQPFHEIRPTPEIEPSANPELEYDDPFAWVTISRGAPLRSGPSVSAPALDYQKMGDKLVLLRFENGWANVEDPSGKRRGWIWHVYLSPSDRVVVQEDRIASNDPADLKTESIVGEQSEAGTDAAVEPVAYASSRSSVEPRAESLDRRRRFADFWPRRQNASVMRLGPAKSFKKRSLRKKARFRRHGMGIRGLFGRYR